MGEGSTGTRPHGPIRRRSAATYDEVPRDVPPPLRVPFSSRPAAVASRVCRRGAATPFRRLEGGTVWGGGPGVVTTL